MPKLLSEKVTLNLTRGTRETLREFYPKLPWSVTARAVLDNFCKKLNERANAEVKDDRANSNSQSITIDLPSGDA